MHYTHNTKQTNLFNFTSYGFNIESDELVKMAREIDWEATIRLVEPLYAQEGRNSNSIRIMLGLEMGKTYYQVSDEIIISLLKKDVSLMMFCGFEVPPIEKEIPSSNSLTDFRNRLTKEVVDEMNALVIRKEIRKLPPRKRTQVASDSSCLPANIRFPTDTGLLSNVAKELINLAEKVRKDSKEYLIRGKRKIGKQILVFNKKRRKTKKEIENFAKNMIKFSDKLHIDLQERISEMTDKQKNRLEQVKAVLKQQTNKWVEGVKKISNRIVSLHDQKVRPIFRGKAGKRMEFGKKVSIQTIGQALIIPGESEYDSYSDTELPTRDVKRFKKMTGRTMKEYSADMGMHSPKNHDLMEQEGIVNGIAHRGKVPKHRKLPSKQTRRRLHRQRQPTEGGFGVLKRRYGCGKIPYKSENTDIIFGFGCMMYNLNWGIKH